MIVAEVPRKSAPLPKVQPAPSVAYRDIGSVERMQLLRLWLVLVDNTMSLERVCMLSSEFADLDLFPLRMRARREIALLRESIARDCAPWFSES